MIRKSRLILWLACFGALLPVRAQLPRLHETAAQPEMQGPSPDLAPAPPAQTPGLSSAADPGAGPAQQVSELLSRAKAFLGIPYRYGGMTPKGFDCSGFVRFVFGSIGVGLNRSSSAQARQGEPVRLNDAMPGDLLFFATRGVRQGISHVALYLGNGEFIHASSWGGPGKHCVRIGELATSYFQTRLVGIRRILKPEDPH